MLDLDETLVHTTTTMTPNYDFRVEIHNKKCTKIFYVLKRPYLDLFLSKMSQYYELVVFTASIRRYADAVIDLVDTGNLITRRYFRQSCIKQGTTFIKDLGVITKDLRKVVIVDNSPAAYTLNEDNAVPIETWYDDPQDCALLSLIPFLVALRSAQDVRSMLRLRHSLLKGRLHEGAGHRL